MADVVEFQFRGDSRDLVNALRDVQRGVDDVGGKAEAMGARTAAGMRSMTAGLFKAQVAFAAVAKVGDLAARAVGAMVRSVPQLADELNQLAKQAKAAGTSVRELQRGQGALDLLTEGGINAADAFQRLDKRIAEAKAGSGEAAKALGAFGVDLDALERAAPVERLAMLADGIDNVGSRSAQSRALVQLFEESGRKLGPAFEAGGDAIRDAADEIERAGLFSDEAARGAEDFADQTMLLSQQMDGLRRQVLAPLLPMMARLVEGFRELIAEGPPLDDWSANIETAFLDIIAPAIAAGVAVLLDMADAIDVVWKGTKLLYGSGGIVERWLAFKEALNTFGDASDEAAEKFEGLMRTVRSPGTVRAAGSVRPSGVGGGGGAAVAGGLVDNDAGEPLGDVEVVAGITTQLEIYNQLIDADNALLDQRRANLTEYSNAAASTAAAIGQIGDAVMRAEMHRAHKTGEGRKKALRDAFVQQQIFANVMATINGVIALTQAWSSAAPPFNAGAMAAATAGNIAHRVAINAVTAAGSSPTRS
jgi:hypothetical protein